MLVVMGAIPPGSPRSETLEVQPQAALIGAEAAGLLNAGLRLIGKTASAKGTLPVSEGWDTWPDEVATCAGVEQALRAAGIPYAQLNDPPTWRDLCAIFAPLVEQAIHTTTE